MFEHMQITFEYLGYHFTPTKRLTQNEFNELCYHYKSDFELGFCTYEWKKAEYDYEEFYDACGEKWFDLFKCEENGRTYIPCENELFEYVHKGKINNVREEAD